MPRIPNRRLLGLFACTLSLAGCLAVSAFAPSAFAEDRLSGYEQQLFFQSYETEGKEQRIARLEERLYGQSQSGDLGSREVRILNSMAAVQRAVPAKPVTQSSPTSTSSGSYDADLPPEDYSTYKPGYAQQYPQPAPEAQAPSEPLPPPDVTNYPTIISLEKRLLGQSFINDTIESRLSRLEMKAFGKTTPKQASIDRVDALLAKYPEASYTSPAVTNSEGYDESPGGFKPNEAESTSMSPSSRDAFLVVDELENKVFGQSYPSHLMTERLDALEQQVIGTKYSGGSIDTRVARLLDRYRISGNQNTSRQGAMPRPGFINPDGSYAHRYQESYQPSGPPVNIQVGAGVGSNTHFSSDLLNMLPPQMRQAAMGGGSRSTSVSGTGTVMMPQQQPGYGGFQAYGGNGTMQYQSYASGPGYSESTRQQTTVIQPDGSQTVYSYEQPNAYGGYGYAQPPQTSYAGNPALFQSLNDLEIKAYGRITQDPFPVRLARLEASLMQGQNYAGYPDAQRVANLQRAYQYQTLNRALGGGNNPQMAGPRIGVPLTPQTQQPSSSPFR